MKEKLNSFLNKYVKSIKEKKPEKDTLNDGFYCIEDEKNKLFIKNEFFVVFVFLEGTDWAERLFKKLYSSEKYETNICEEITINEDFIAYDIETEDKIYENAIIIKKIPEENISKISYDVSIPVVLRLYKTEIPLSDIDKLGESSEIIIESEKRYSVDIILNGKVIGKGILFKEKGNFKLKVKEINI